MPTTLNEWLAVAIIVGLPVTFIAALIIGPRLAPERRRFIETWIFRPLWIFIVLFGAWNIYAGPHHLTHTWLTDGIEVVVAVALGAQMRTWFRRRESPATE